MNTALKSCSQPAIFFITGLTAQKAHFRQKYEYYRLSVSPLYNLLGFNHFLSIISNFNQCEQSNKENWQMRSVYAEILRVTY